MQKPDFHGRSPLSPNEIITGALAFCTVVVTTWGLAGTASWAPPVFTALSVLTAGVSILISWREGEPVKVRAFLPALLLILMVGVSLLNLSHTRAAGTNGVWIPREGWLPWLPATVDPAKTVWAMLPWLSALLLGGALRQAALGPRAVRLLWGALLAHGLLVAIVGAAFYFINNSLVLGLYPDRYGYHFASFVYRNHWAAYVILLVPLALGYSLSALRNWSRERGRLDGMVPGVCAALLLALTLPMPGSRSGMVLVSLLLVGAFARMGWVLWFERPEGSSSRSGWLPLVGVVILLAAVGSVGAVLNRDVIQRHWMRTVNQVQGLTAGQEELRISLTRDAVRMASDRPMLGWGIGSFGLVFPIYQGNYLRDDQGRIRARVLHAHNDWAELWSETGLFGAMIFLVPLAIRLRVIGRTKSVLSKWGGVSVLLVLVYAVVDFPLHCPAVLFLWVTILSTAAPRSTGQRLG